MALGSTQPLTEMSTGNTSLGCKGSHCVGLTTLPPSCADCLEIWEPRALGTLRACPGLQWDCFTFYRYSVIGVRGFLCLCKQWTERNADVSYNTTSRLKLNTLRTGDADLRF